MQQQQPQEWRRRAALRRPLGTSPGGRAPSSALAHTASSADKISRRSATTPSQAAAANERQPSQWRALRSSVRIRATREDASPSRERHAEGEARIADLCEHDRQKIAKLVRRLAEMGALHEQTESEFHRERQRMESEISELRTHVRQDVQEIDELSEKLKSTLRALRDHQERVLVLEESHEAETRQRMDTDQTMDLLKLEVEKLHKLVRMQKEQMETKELEQKQRSEAEIDRLTRELQEAQSQLLTERRERIEEKQRLLEERLKASSNLHQSSSASTTVQNQQNPAHAPIIPTDVSSFLNNSVDLPDKVRDMMDEWKQRMKDAMIEAKAAVMAEMSTATPAAATRDVTRQTRQPSDREDMNAVADQNEINACGRSRICRQETSLIKHATSIQEIRVSRSRFDQELLHESDEEVKAGDSEEVESDDERSYDTRHHYHRYQEPQDTPVRQQEEQRRYIYRRPPPTPRRRRRHRLHRDVRHHAPPIELELRSEDEYADEEQEHTTPARRADPTMFTNAGEEPTPSFGSVYDACLFDVVDALETPPRAVDGPSSNRSAADTSTASTRFRSLLSDLEAREQRLAWMQEQTPLRRTPELRVDTMASSMDRDLEMFNQVKDVYAADREFAIAPPSSRAVEVNGHDAEDTPLSTGDLSVVRESIEQDMQQLLQERTWLD